MVIFARNAVNSAMFMILSFISTSGLFVLLNAYFIAIIQVLVYAGAVMVLFLFIIMLLNVSKVTSFPSRFAFLSSICGLIVLLIGVLYFFLHVPESMHTPLEEPLNLPSQLQPFSFTTSVKSFGFGLFTKYMLPFQVAGFLLLIAMLGVIVISKKDQNETEINKEHS